VNYRNSEKLVRCIVNRKHRFREEKHVGKWKTHSSIPKHRRNEFPSVILHLDTFLLFCITNDITFGRWSCFCTGPSSFVALPYPGLFCEPCYCPRVALRPSLSLNATLDLQAHGQFPRCVFDWNLRQCSVN